MLGIIGGTALLQAELPPLDRKLIATPYGTAEVYAGKIAVIKRHQYNTPPAQINHRAHLAALKILGVDRVISIGSTGSMKAELPPGSLVVASGFFSPWNIPTFHQHDIFHVSPAVDEELSRGLQELAPEAQRGIYFQTNGPRFETAAEIAHFAAHTDVVGMTAASEITLANELGIRAAALCTVDNYANGIGGEGAPSYEEIVKIARRNGDKVTSLIKGIVEKFA